MAKVLIPTPLRQFTEKLDSVELAGGTVGEVLSALTAQFPDIRKQLFNDEGKLRSFVNVYLNDEDIRYLKKDATPVAATDTLSIVPSIAGGSTMVAPPPVTLSNDEILRYSRHLIMPEVGMDGQLQLKQAKVLLVGTGGLGAPVGLYLAAAGVGRIGLVDFDIVDFTNLQRQVIHGTKDVGRKKLDSAADRMRDINPNVQIDRYDVALMSENALDIISGYDMVVDGTDNFPTRYLVNDACVILKKPNVYGSIFRFEGQATIFAYPGGPCYRCREAHLENRRADGRPADALRCLGDAFPRAQAAAEFRVSRVRRSSDHHQADRLSTVLRDHEGRSGAGRRH
jgi:molybdopterin/thiamine biosynthesis adenylyltransferase/molybdopterin converting factor small subunit